MGLVELFCGCGGFSLGAHQAGMKVAVAYDIDPILTSSYAKNFPGTRLALRDVATLTGHDIVADAGGRPTGIIGGPPCQGFSEIGRRDRNDPRRELLYHFFRIIAEVEPDFFVMENVRGLALADARPVLNAALDLIASDYNILEPTIWDAADFGAATRRKRVFVVGLHKRTGRRIIREDFIKQQKRPTSVEQAIADLSGASQIENCGQQGEFDRWVLRASNNISAYAAQLRSNDRIFTGHMPTEHTPAVIARFAQVHQGGVDKVGRHPRLKLDGQCPTLRAGTGSDRGSYQSVRPIHPVENRVITVREAARLQGFPDNHLFHPTVWHSFRMIGNSVSPIMSRAIFRAIKHVLEFDLSVSKGVNPTLRLPHEQHEGPQAG